MFPDIWARVVTLLAKGFANRTEFTWTASRRPWWLLPSQFTRPSPRKKNSTPHPEQFEKTGLGVRGLGGSGDTTTCRVTGVTLHRHVRYKERWEGGTWRFCARSGSCGSSLSRFPPAPPRTTREKQGGVREPSGGRWAPGVCAGGRCRPGPPSRAFLLRGTPERRRGTRTATARDCFRVSGFGFRKHSSRFRGFRVLGSGFRVSGSEFRLSSSGLRFSAFGFRIQGFEFRVLGEDLGAGVVVVTAGWHPKPDPQSRTRISCTDPPAGLERERVRY